MPAYVFPALEATAAQIRSGKNIAAVWVVKKAIAIGSAPVTAYKMAGNLCTYISVDDIPHELIDERDIYLGGKQPIKVNSGAKVGDFTITLKGDAVDSQAALAGLSFTNLAALEYGKVYNDVGCLLMFSHDNNQGLQRVDVICDLSVKLMQGPGSAEGDVTATVTFYSNNSRHMAVSGTNVFNTAFFYDDGGGIVNAAAPDGAILTYNLNAANGAALSGVITAVQIRQTTDANAPNYTTTTLEKYFVEAQYMRPSDTTWQDFTDNDATFNAATGVLTTTSALADGTRIFLVYATAKASANYQTSTTDFYMWKAWGDFQ